MNSAPPPYGMTTSPYPPAASPGVPPQGVPPQGVPQQSPYPLNSGYAPQTVVYSNAPPSGAYAYNAVPQHGADINALNANQRFYQRPFFSRPYAGNRKMVYIMLAGFFILFITFVIVFAVVFLNGNYEFKDARKKHY